MLFKCEYETAVKRERMAGKVHQSHINKIQVQAHTTSTYQTNNDTIFRKNLHAILSRASHLNQLFIVHSAFIRNINREIKPNSRGSKRSERKIKPSNTTHSHTATTEKKTGSK